MSGTRNRLGDAGERYAERRLIEHGWRILERKWRGEAGEIDLIADDGEAIVFVEVRTRRGEYRGSAEESITDAKARRLIQLGAEYVARDASLDERLWRVDLIAITLDRAGRISRYSHIRDACLDE